MSEVVGPDPNEYEGFKDPKQLVYAYIQDWELAGSEGVDKDRLRELADASDFDDWKIACAVADLKKRGEIYETPEGRLNLPHE